MVFPSSMLWVAAVSFAISAIGFKYYIWFFSIGYGLSIAGLGVLLPLLFGGRMSAGTVLCCLLFVVYGLRLGGYLAYRELKVRSYSENMKGEIKDSKKIPVFVKVCIWTACALLYVLQVLPVFYRLANGAGSNAFTYVGAAVMAVGLVMEAAADIQKNEAKKVNPRRFVDTGLTASSAARIIWARCSSGRAA